MSGVVSEACRASVLSLSSCSSSSWGACRGCGPPCRPLTKGRTMLKFRMSNSMKARRAAEAQRKVLEEKLKMEWAWKPMAAVMNEKNSDLVYWVPPLYTSNLLTSFSTPCSSMSSSLTSTPSSSFRRRSSVKNPPSPLCHQGSSIRRRKLATRRAKLSPELSLQGIEDEERRRKDEGTTDEDRESGIQDEFHDSSMDEEAPFDQTLNKTNYLKYNLKNLEKQKQVPKKTSKFKHIPTLLKVVNKLSQIYTLPVKQPPPPMYGFRNQKPKDFRTTSIKKPKRPSVKIYRVPSQQRNSIKKPKTEEEAQQQPFYVITKNKAPFSNLQQQRASLRSKDSSERTHIGLPTLTENELRNAHLEMILKILANLYEEKITEQDTELGHIKSKMQLQEKVIKQTAQLVLDLKEQMRTLQAKMDFNEELKKFYKRSRMDVEPSFPYQPLEPLVEESNESHKSQLSLNSIDDQSEIRDEICDSFQLEKTKQVLEVELHRRQDDVQDDDDDGEDDDDDDDEDDDDDDDESKANEKNMEDEKRKDEDEENEEDEETYVEEKGVEHNQRAKHKIEQEQKQDQEQEQEQEEQEKQEREQGQEKRHEQELEERHDIYLSTQKEGQEQDHKKQEREQKQEQEQEQEQKQDQYPVEISPPDRQESAQSGSHEVTQNFTTVIYIQNEEI